jgi:hypothetical protein
MSGRLPSGTGVTLVTKGAFEHVLEVCVRSADGRPLDSARLTTLRNRYLAWSAQGTRVLAVAARSLGDKSSYGRDDERDLDFVGFLTFLDRPKEGVAEALIDLAKLGVSVKLITGDGELVAKHVATAVGMRADRILTGKDLDELHDEALWSAAERTDLFGTSRARAGESRVTIPSRVGRTRAASFRDRRSAPRNLAPDQAGAGLKGWRAGSVCVSAIVMGRTACVSSNQMYSSNW